MLCFCPSVKMYDLGNIKNIPERLCTSFLLMVADIYQTKDVVNMRFSRKCLMHRPTHIRARRELPTVGSAFSGCRLKPYRAAGGATK